LYLSLGVAEDDGLRDGRRGHTACYTYLSLGVAEDDRLRDGQRVVEVTQRVKLPLLTLDGDKELLQPFQCQLITAPDKKENCH